MYYRCPRCSAVFEGQQSNCPYCNKKLKYHAPVIEKKIEKKAKKQAINSKDDKAMLRLVDIVKVYQAGNNSVKAVDGVSLNFRKNEFVSILGPSGSGKTTLLNIIGGLDHYTSGDLIIAGKSTKQYKDRDWDKYRNLRVGFIFQSYNLIPHQSVLANVELALTISGIGKEERKQRAIEALNKVGLKDQINKKPNQLSGGQCQRVAIARALVNNPEILLADEPTGALDTKTSKQIMDLIAEIAKDRLVIMVTHNPDLAEEYSSRIIKLLDGKISDDSNPLNIKEDFLEEEKVTKAKMGFWTATKLSFRNLVSKRKRTILVAIASSIGIIGVSTVLSVSYGVTDYIRSMQDDMLSSYPLQIAEASVDLSSLMSGLSNDEKRELSKFDVNTQVGMDSMISYLMRRYSDITNIKTNEINKDLVSYVHALPTDTYATIQDNYGIDVTNNIFANWTSSSVEAEGKKKLNISLNGLTQRYIAELKTVDGFGTYASYVDLFTNFMRQYPGNEEYILSQYDLLGNSTFATKENEIMLVVDGNTTLTDFTLAQMGYYEHDEFINIGKKAVKYNELTTKYNNGDINKETYDAECKKLDEEYPYRTEFEYTDLIGSEFTYYPHSTLWNYGNVSTSTTMGGTLFLSNDDGHLFYFTLTTQNLLGRNLDILAGVKIEPGKPIDLNNLTYFVRQASDSRDPDTFLLGAWAYADVSKAIVDPSSAISTTDYLLISPTGAVVKLGEDITSFPNVVKDVHESGLVEGYNYPAVANESWSDGVTMKVTGILRAKPTTNFGCLSRGVYYTPAFTDKFITDANADGSKIMNEETHGLKKMFASGEAATTKFKAYVTYSYIDFTDTENPKLVDGGYSNAINTSSGISGLFSGLLGSDTTGDNQAAMRAISGLKAYNDNELYVFEKIPQSMDIYPNDFANKDKITKYFDRWNSDDTLIIDGHELKRADRTDLTYTDTVEVIITMINSLITIVTSALVAFTSLSLVVSCFMIAVITYISVVERVKEIGVIRSLGGRKKDVSRLFTAENLITGLASGIFGIAVTYLLSLIINVTVSFFGVPAIAMLPWWIALIMIGLSIFLNVVSGFIPSRNAARQDPVEALRSE